MSASGERNPKVMRTMSWARPCRIPAFVDLQRLIVKHRESILAATYDDLSNGRIELVNTRIQLSQRSRASTASAMRLIDSCSGHSW